MPALFAFPDLSLDLAWSNVITYSREDSSSFLEDRWWYGRQHVNNQLVMSGLYVRKDVEEL